jgi:acyl carrier protein
MENLKKYNKVFMEVFSVKESELNEGFNNYSVDNWDSINQLALVTEIENEFDILIDTNDILDFKSYEIGKSILKNYEITIQ